MVCCLYHTLFPVLEFNLHVIALFEKFDIMKLDLWFNPLGINEKATEKL